MQYGPLTPQECEIAINWLRARDIHFEIVKDQAAENDFRANTGANIIKQAEFRTETFLAQIFYLDVSELEPKLEKELNLFFGVAPETLPLSMTEKPESIDLKPAILKSARTKQLWAILLIAIWALLFLSYYFIF